MTSLIKIAFRYKNIVNFTEFKRYAGHSKWQNIKHTKMTKDAEKAMILRNFLNSMRVAIAEGKSAKPEDNSKLSKIIEQAQKKSMPMATIKNFLAKMQASKTGATSVLYESRGPSGCVILVHLLSSNPHQTRQFLNHHLKKCKFSSSDAPSMGLYDQKGIICAEVENRDMDKVLDDAIEAGAEEAEKLKEGDKEFLQFTCAVSVLYRVKGKLEELKYDVISAEEEYIPQVWVNLKDEEMEQLSKLYDRLNTMEEVVKLYNNVS